MKVFESDDKFVLTVNGGYFKEFVSEPKAIILNSRPKPLRKWLTPTEKDENVFTDVNWNYDYEFSEYLCDGDSVYILEILYTRYRPGYAKGKAEFIINSEYANEKIMSLRLRGSIQEFHWDDIAKRWNDYCFS
ncbi:hypothetical protein [Mesobacillus harenae]|uniref:hypothetical protein n=1 Tax=Mesobacillus harenae TaxID=2213203 RepID=UPI0015805BF2|nr:hypothetical protein [Mesobacillus harenae]